MISGDYRCCFGAARSNSTFNAPRSPGSSSDARRRWELPFIFLPSVRNLNCTDIVLLRNMTDIVTVCLNNGTMSSFHINNILFVLQILAGKRGDFRVRIQIAPGRASGCTFFLTSAPSKVMLSVIVISYGGKHVGDREIDKRAWRP